MLARRSGAYTNLLISYEQSDRVIDDPRVKGVALTGSVEAGRSVAARAGQNLKKSTMEFGGSDAFIVLDTVADAFLARFKAALEALKRGDPMEEKTTLGPLNLDWTDAGLPFGGVKHSGYGRELGRIRIQEFVNKKLVRSGRMAAPI